MKNYLLKKHDEQVTTRNLLTQLPLSSCSYTINRNDRANLKSRPTSISVKLKSIKKMREYGSKALVNRSRCHV